jgi:hypothetical protein
MAFVVLASPASTAVGNAVSRSAGAEEARIMVRLIAALLMLVALGGCAAVLVGELM